MNDNELKLARAYAQVGALTAALLEIVMLNFPSYDEKQQRRVLDLVDDHNRFMKDIYFHPTTKETSETND